MKQFLIKVLIGVTIGVTTGAILLLIQTRGKDFLSAFSRQAFVLDPLYFWFLLVLASIGIYAILRGLYLLFFGSKKEEEPIEMEVTIQEKPTTAREVYRKDVYEGVIVEFDWGGGWDDINAENFKYICPKEGKKLDERVRFKEMTYLICSKCETKYVRRAYDVFGADLATEVLEELQTRITTKEWKGAEQRVNDIQEWEDA